MIIKLTKKQVDKLAPLRKKIEEYYDNATYATDLGCILAFQVFPNQTKVVIDNNVNDVNGFIRCNVFSPLESRKIYDCFQQILNDRKQHAAFDCRDCYKNKPDKPGHKPGQTRTNKP